MNNTLVVVADLAGYKAFSLHGDPWGQTSPHLDLVEHFQTAEAHDRLVDKVSDLSGRFPRGTGTRAGGAMSDGERHNIELETRKRLVRQLAQRLNQLISQQKPGRFLLAASREINHQLVEELDRPARALIQKNICADLTKFGHADLLRQFAPAP